MTCIIEKKTKTGAQTINTPYKDKIQNIEKHPHGSVFSENLFIELLFQFGTQLENANTIWWENSKNAGVLLIPWREKMKCELQIRNNWGRKQRYLKVDSISCRS